MDPITFGIAQGAAGAGSDPVYVDDVFSTYLWNGNYDTTRSAITIDNGIDLSGEGGLVWTKHRNYTNSHQLYDTERGAGSPLYSNITNGQGGNSVFSSFNSNGFSLTAGTFGTDALNGDVADNYVSWTFRKAPGFFDVVTYTGTGSVQNIPHNLGSVPGMIIVKETSSSGESWGVYHRSLAASQTLLLNDTIAAFSSTNSWNSTAPTSSVFTVGTETRVNASGESYVAYLFAHDDQSFGTGGNEAIIKCGSYTGTTSGVDLDLGFEPQWVMIKRATGSSTNYTNWVIMDNMRGVITGGTDTPLASNISTEENGSYLYGSANPANLIEFSPTGIRVDPSGGQYTSVCTNGETYVYMAIRRPNKPPTVATDVFSVTTTTNDNNFNTTGFPVDAAIAANTNHTYGRIASARLLGQNALFTNTAAAENGFLTSNTWTSNTQFRYAYAGNGYNWANYAFKRAPGFMDVVAWAGDGTSNRAINHNLTVTPELYITKRRTASENWVVTTDDLITSAEGFRLNDASAKLTGLSAFNSVSSPTSSVFYVGSDSSINGSGNNYIAYLFASLDGISKVGSYTGNGTSQVIDCGFTAGARFVLIKTTSISNNWRVFDTVRGINASANDPVLSLNDNSGQDPNKDWLRPNNSGFEVNTSDDNVNGNNQEYLFLAIA